MNKGKRAVGDLDKSERMAIKMILKTCVWGVD
jgi:hypothetical protein